MQMIRESGVRISWLWAFMSIMTFVDVDGLFVPCRIHEGNYTLQAVDFPQHVVTYGGDADAQLHLKQQKKSDLVFQLQHVPVPDFSPFYRAQFTLQNISPAGMWGQYQQSFLQQGHLISKHQHKYTLTLDRQASHGIHFISYCEPTNDGRRAKNKRRLRTISMNDELSFDSYIGAKDKRLFTGAPLGLALDFYLDVVV